MKKRNVLYWIMTGIMAAFMLMGSTQVVLRVPAALAWFVHLEYPSYLLPFIDIAKILGVTAVVAPGIRRLKEWAYAGLVFDLLGATYSHISVSDSSAWIVPVIGLLLVAGSYAFYRKKTDHEEVYAFI